MPEIPAQDARGIFTKTLIATFKERPQVFAFFTSFFPSKVSTSREVSIEVQRGSEMIAVDVLRGTEGNRNSVAKSTEKIFLPPYYREFFDMTELALYDRLFGSTGIDESVFADMTAETADKVVLLRDKIKRAIEKQCADVLTTGIVTLKSGTNIDFKRKAASLVDNSATPWTNDANSPYTQLEAGCKFLREVGKSQGSVVNAIFGSQAMNAFLENAIVQARADIKNFSLDMIREPQRNAVGASLHGRITVGSYMVNLWTYPEVYQDVNENITPYMHEKKVIMIPETTNFRLAFAAVPRLLEAAEGVSNAAGEFIVGEYKDPRNTAHIMDVKSAPVAIPVAVDQIYTMQVVA